MLREVEVDVVQTRDRALPRDPAQDVVGMVAGEVAAVLHGVEPAREGPGAAAAAAKMAAVLQARDAPPAKVLQPADNPDVDIVPLRFGVKYASEQPMLALEYRDKASGELKLEEIPLAIQDDSKALEVYAALKESHAPVSYTHLTLPTKA